MIAEINVSNTKKHIKKRSTNLFGKMENIPDIDKYPFDKSVKQTYAAFMKEAAKYDNQSAENGRTALWPFFGHTYFYEYFYMKYSK